MADTLTINVRDIRYSDKVHVRIPIINKTNPCFGYDATEDQIRQLMSIPNYEIKDAATGVIINGHNLQEYFPGGGGGGGVTPQQVEAMIANSIDTTVSETSTNSIQNKVIKQYVDTGLSDKASTSSLSTVATSGSYNDLNDKPTIDSELSDSSTNAVQNKVITGTIGDINTVLEEVL